jgi:hypothetical protein
MTTEHEHGEHGEHEVQPLLTVADFDGDGAVNWSDLTDLFSRYGSKTGEEKYHFLYDLNVDGQIDQKDLVLAVSSIGEAVPLLDRQIAQATQATMKYYGANGLANAIADGYLPVTPEAKGHGIHYYNQKLALEIGNSDTLDVEHPVGLNYDSKGNLLAVFYVRNPKTQQATPENPFGPFLVDPTDDHPPTTSFDALDDHAWHHHHSAWIRGIGLDSLESDSVYFEEDVPLSMVVSRAEQAQFQFYPNSDQFYNPKFWMLHGWFHSPNPEGTFAITNPNVGRYAFEELGLHGELHNMPDSLPLLRGTDGDEKLVGSAKQERINGFDGDDEINGKKGDDLIWGGMDNDTVYGGQGKDMLYGGWDDDWLNGNQGDDRIFGGNGDDQIWGSQGDDLLRGGLGSDTLTGDVASGKYQGQDTFVLAADEGMDTITDFQVDLDLIVLEGGLSLGQLSIVQNGTDTAINLLSDQTKLAILLGVDATTLLAADVFVTV